MSNNFSSNIFAEAFKRTAMHYIQNLELPELPPAPRTTTSNTTAATTAATANTTATTVDTVSKIDTATCINDRMLQSFAAGLTVQQKSDVLNSTLLAQLAANKAYPTDTTGKYDVSGWYSKFSEVLLNLGWVSQNTFFKNYQMSGKSFTVDKALLEILTGLLEQNSLLLAKAAISALKDLPSTDNKFTLFNFNTCSDQMGNLSLGVCTESNGTVDYSFAAMYLETSKKIKQILFVDFSTSEFKLYAGTKTITLNSDVYAIVREEVVKKLNNMAAAYISALEI